MKRFLLALWRGVMIVGVLAVGGVILWGLYNLGIRAIALAADLPPSERATVLTASLSVVGSVSAVMIGRAYEKRRELEALHRDKKIPIYDRFLKGFFDVFQNSEKYAEDPETTINFIREWQRELILWGGAPVVNRWIEWQKTGAGEEPDARGLFKVDELLRAIRKELGHSNKGIDKGSFIRFILREPDLFFAAAKQNPDITLSELSKLEAALAAQQEEKKERNT